MTAAPVLHTEKRRVTNMYQGTPVVDDYQWLENAAAPEVAEWSRQQNAASEAYFSHLPYRDGLAQQLMQIRSDESARWLGLIERHGRLFALRFKPPAQQPVLVRLSSLYPPTLWRAIFDPNGYNTNGTTTIDWFVPSPDGKLVAVSLSEKGSEEGTLHIFEVDTGKELSDKVPRVQYPTGGGSAAWLEDSSGILYTR
jgi:prolyl oligopeptidase